jgi:hypothetical protein
MPTSDPPSEVPETSPDRIPPGAWAQLELLDGERIARCWRTAFGYLVMTNLRCVHVWPKSELFERTEWHTGPTFFFYNLSPPRVVAARFLELSEAHDIEVGTARFWVRDPSAVCEEIEQARAPGRREWEARRVRVERELHRPMAIPYPPGATVIVREIVKVRCNFCGNLMDATADRCPFCGAPQR